MAWRLRRQHERAQRRRGEAQRLPQVGRPIENAVDRLAGDGHALVRQVQRRRPRLPLLRLLGRGRGRRRVESSAPVKGSNPRCVRQAAMRARNAWFGTSSRDTIGSRVCGDVLWVASQCADGRSFMELAVVGHDGVGHHR